MTFGSRPVTMRPSASNVRPLRAPRGGAGDSGAAMHIDYKDVLEQAVANERWRVLRAVRAAFDTVPTDQVSSRSQWSSEDRTASYYKSDLLKKLDEIERGAA